MDLAKPLSVALTDGLRATILMVKEEAYVRAEPAPGVRGHEAVVDHDVRSYADVRIGNASHSREGLPF